MIRHHPAPRRQPAPLLVTPRGRLAELHPRQAGVPVCEEAPDDPPPPTIPLPCPGLPGAQAHEGPQASSVAAAGGGMAAARPSAAARAALVEPLGRPALPTTSSESPKARYISKRLLPLRGSSLDISS